MTWGQMIAESLGVSALIAVPMIVEFLGHRMQHSLQIENLLDVPVAWQLSTIHGQAALTLPDASIPARTTMQRALDPVVHLIKGPLAVVAGTGFEPVTSGL